MFKYINVLVITVFLCCPTFSFNTELILQGRFIDYFENDKNQLIIQVENGSNMDYYQYSKDKLELVISNNKFDRFILYNNTKYMSVILKSQNESTAFWDKYKNNTIFIKYKQVVKVSNFGNGKYILALLDKKQYGKGYLALFDGTILTEFPLGDLNPIFIGDFTPFCFDKLTGNIYFQCFRRLMQNKKIVFENGIFVYNINSCKSINFIISEKNDTIYYPYALNTQDKIIFIRSHNEKYTLIVKDKIGVQ